MINKLGIIDGIVIYEDSYMEDDKIIMGRKEGGYRFLVANTKTGNLIAKIGLNRYRKEKLDKLNNVL
jgi:hypothetical protein